MKVCTQYHFFRPLSNYLAHFIRNGNSRMAQAVCALDSVSRWAVTGTPIQNRIGDLSSLLKFIRAHPYTDQKRFDMDISRLWKSGEADQAVKRLKRLSGCLLLRRPKSTINLPPRRDLVYEVDFTPEEKAVYEQIRQQTITKINEALGNQLGPSKSSVYVNVLQQIESLRLFSNLGLHYHSRHVKQLHQSSEPEEWARIAQRTFNSQREMTSLTCLQCSSALGLTDNFLDDAAPSTTPAQFTSCLRYICHDCAEKLNQGGYLIECGHSPPCASSAVSTSAMALEEVGNPSAPQIRMSSINLPSKIRTLIEDIKRAPRDVKWLVSSPNIKGYLLTSFWYCILNVETHAGFDKSRA
jgi:SWI/SNF-related matrix-associated actin-dependent regulator of chromatin subfamily A3